MKRFIAYVLFILLVSGCSVQKRHYMKGFYVNHQSKIDSKQTKLIKAEPKDAKDDVLTINKIELGSKEIEDIIELASIKDEEILIFKKPVIKFDDCGDLITLKNGDEIKAKVIEVTLNEIKYKKCENIDGPIYTLAKKDVFSIKYANGTKDIIKDEVQAPSKPTSSAPTEKQTHWGALVGFILSLIGISLLGIIFGFIGLNAIKEHPEKYKGTGLANLAIILGFIWIILLLIILLVP